MLISRYEIPLKNASALLKIISHLKKTKLKTVCRNCTQKGKPKEQMLPKGGNAVGQWPRVLVDCQRSQAKG